MTDIDRQADIEVRAAGGRIEARVPLAGQVSGEWIASYGRLAVAAAVPASAEPSHDRAWLVVNLSAGGTEATISQTMDAARALLAAADTAATGISRSASAEATVRDWWSQRRLAGDHEPVSRNAVIRTGIGADRRVSLATALATAIAVLVLLPPRFSLGPSWLVPSLEALLLVAIFAADHYLTDRRSAVVRAMSFALVLVLVAGAAFITGRLVVDLVQGGPETNSPADLLEVGFGVWVYAIIAFAFLYWLLDGHGPEARISDPAAFPDLAFPEQLNPPVAAPGWRPEFADYLYLGFTNATAFSPTDVMPLARWGKLAMTVQAMASLVILGLVIARAVNIFK